MKRIVRPPTAEEKQTVRLVERLIAWGASLNRACRHHKISAAAYYRHGGRHPIDLRSVKKARKANKYAASN